MANRPGTRGSPPRPGGWRGATLRAASEYPWSRRRAVGIVRHDDARALADVVRRRSSTRKRPPTVAGLEWSSCRPTLTALRRRLPRRPAPVACGHRARQLPWPAGARGQGPAAAAARRAEASRSPRATGPSAAAGSAAPSAVKLPAVSVAMADDRLDEWTASGVAHRRRLRSVLPRAPGGPGPTAVAPAALPPPGRGPPAACDASVTRDATMTEVTFLSRAEHELRDDRLRAAVRKATNLMADRRLDALATLVDPDGLRDAARSLRAGAMADLPDLLDAVVEPPRSTGRARALGPGRRGGHGHRPRPGASRTAPRSSPRASRWPVRRSTSTRCSRPTGGKWWRPTSASSSSSWPGRPRRTSSPPPSTTTGTRWPSCSLTMPAIPSRLTSAPRRRTPGCGCGPASWPPASGSRA